MDNNKTVKSSFITNRSLIVAYLKYLFRSSYYRGHGVHSPYVYEFVRKVLFAKHEKHRFDKIKKLRAKLLRNKNLITINDLGAGSRINNDVRKSISTIASASSIKHKYGKLLSEIVKFYKPEIVLELGTALGISTAYLSMNMNNDNTLFTVDADENLIELAKNNLKHSSNTNIKFINESFDTAITKLIDNEHNNFDLVFFDGNHKYEASVKYFNQLTNKINNDTIFIFDDIHWSSEMEKAWKYIVEHEKTKVSIDLFQVGIVFFRRELSKQHYIIRF